jgi:2'-5' RNA ligase
LRLFTAVPVVEQFREACSAAHDSFVREAPSWAGEKWVATQNLHVTLVFLGDVDQGDVPALIDGIGVALADIAVPVLSCPRVTAVSHEGRARMLWVSLEDESGAARSIAEALLRVSRVFGIKPASRPYSPHVTLCRTRHPHEAPPVALEAAQSSLNVMSGCVSDPSVILLSSRLAPHGPTYEKVAVWSIGGSDPGGRL